MAAGRSISVPPTAIRRLARSCCSNWLLIQASIVRRPESCGRGAIVHKSLPSRVTRNSTQRTPVTSNCSRPTPRKWPQPPARFFHRMAWAERTSRMPLTWRLQEGVKNTQSAVFTAHADHLNQPRNRPELQTRLPTAHRAPGRSASERDRPGTGLFRRNRNQRSSKFPARWRQRRAANPPLRGSASKGVTGKAVPAKEGLLAQTMLRGVQNCAGGPNQRALRGGFRGNGGYVFKFECDHVDRGGERADAVEIFVRGVNFNIGDLAGGGIAIRRVRVDG